MKKAIIAKTSIWATHQWPEAPDNRAYLRSLHAHRFGIEAFANIGEDRAIEFHDMVAKLDNLLQKVVYHDDPRSGDLPSFGKLSCESIGEMILRAIPEISMVVVSEDDICSSAVSRPAPQQRKGLLNRPLIVTICGSTKFKKEYEEAEARLELQGYAIFTVGCFPHHDGIPITEAEKVGLDWIHKQKIAMSDAIFVVNVGGYIGSSTESEIRLAEQLGKAIMYLEPEHVR